MSNAVPEVREKELKEDLFIKPSSEYRGAPFWSWNCKLTNELLEKEIKDLKDMGFGGFHMHVRSGLQTPIFPTNSWAL